MGVSSSLTSSGAGVGIAEEMGEESGRYAMDDIWPS